MLEQDLHGFDAEVVAIFVQDEHSLPPTLPPSPEGDHVVVGSPPPGSPPTIHEHNLAQQLSLTSVVIKEPAPRTRWHLDPEGVEQRVLATASRVEALEAKVATLQAWSPTPRLVSRWSKQAVSK